MESDQPQAESHLVRIQVNDVAVTIAHKATGLQIKHAAISAHVPIQPDFVLSVELGHGRTRIVTDGETIALHEGESFVAVAPDDNS